MVKKSTKFVSKVLIIILKVITDKIVEYISSEEFRNKLKELTKKTVEEVVKIIISEKKAATSK